MKYTFGVRKEDSYQPVEVSRQTYVIANILERVARALEKIVDLMEKVK